MKITHIETFKVAPRWLFLLVHTDEGVQGWGEPVVEGRADTVRTAVHELGEQLVGLDPLLIEHHWQVLSKGGFYRHGAVLASAVAGIDQALWDIAGKARGVPVHELLGGPVRDTARVYSWVGGDEPSELRDAVLAQVEGGFTAVKMNVGGRMSGLPGPAEVSAVVERAVTAREVLGPHRDLAIDFHGRVSPAAARILLPRLAEVAPIFVEEPVLPELGSEHLRSLVECSPVPLATGERLYSRWDFEPVLRSGIAVAQPDLSHAGGISEVRRIAAQAELHGVFIAPHCPLGPISLAASLQIAFATPNFLIQEQGIGIHYNGVVSPLDYLLETTPLRFRSGAVERLVGPGLGIAIDEAAVRAADAIGHDWSTPQWRDAHGAFAEW